MTLQNNSKIRDDLLYFIWKFQRHFKDEHISEIPFPLITNFVDDFLNGKMFLDNHLLREPMPESIKQYFKPKTLNDPDPT